MVSQDRQKISGPFQQAGQDQAYSSLELGDIVWVNKDEVSGKKSIDNAPFRRLLVTGLWFKDGRIEKIEGYKFSTNLKERLRTDEFFIGQHNYKQFHADVPQKIQTAITYIIDNTPRYFKETSSPPQKINENLWLDILVRRADAIFNSNSCICSWPGRSPELSSSDLARVGYFFENILPINVRSGKWLPDIANREVQRLPVQGRGWDQKIVNEIAVFSAAYRRFALGLKKFNNEGYPASNQWETYNNIRRVSFPQRIQSSLNRLIEN